MGCCVSVEPRGERPSFAALKLFSRSFAPNGPGGREKLRLRDFERFSDDIAIITPGRRFGSFRFGFFGATLAETTPRGDLTDIEFGDLLGDPYYRSALAGYRHVAHAGVPHVTRDHPIGSEFLFTRLLIPVFAGNRLDMILGIADFHPAPLPLPLPPSTGPMQPGVALSA